MILDRTSYSDTEEETIVGSIIFGLIFLVGLVVIGGIILNVIFGVADTGKSMAAGVAIQSGPVRGEWRGLPIPVATSELMDMTKLVATSPALAGTHHVAFNIDGARVAVIAQWFQNNWTRVGFGLDAAPQTPGQREYRFRDPRNGGAVVVAFQVERSPFVHTAVLMSMILFYGLFRSFAVRWANADN